MTRYRCHFVHDLFCVRRLGKARVRKGVYRHDFFVERPVALAQSLGDRFGNARFLANVQDDNVLAPAVLNVTGLLGLVGRDCRLGSGSGSGDAGTGTGTRIRSSLFGLVVVVVVVVSFFLALGSCRSVILLVPGLAVLLVFGRVFLSLFLVVVVVVVVVVVSQSYTIERHSSGPSRHEKVSLQ